MRKHRTAPRVLLYTERWLRAAMELSWEQPRRFPRGRLGLRHDRHPRSTRGLTSTWLNTRSVRADARPQQGGQTGNVSISIANVSIRHATHTRRVTSNGQGGVFSSRKPLPHRMNVLGFRCRKLPAKGYPEARAAILPAQNGWYDPLSSSRGLELLVGAGRPFVLCS
jgi:hypothetical protein